MAHETIFCTKSRGHYADTDEAHGVSASSLLGARHAAMKLAQLLYGPTLLGLEEIDADAPPAAPLWQRRWRATGTQLVEREG